MRRGPARARRARAALLVASGALLAACVADTDGAAPATDARATAGPVAGGAAVDADALDAATSPPVPREAASPGEVVVDLGGASLPFDERVLGSNLPAWLGSERLTDPDLLAAVAALGTPLVRMPGGSWSNHYDWLGCEEDDEARCRWTWAAEPSDYLRFLTDTGIAGSWTVSINGTAQEAAALVALFNGEVGDATPIGVDRRGRDWEDVDRWARLRASLGFPDPVPIALWEVGNEVYGARGSAGPGCADFGWEDVWTCDGGEYARGSDELGQDGFVDFHAAMTAVDPTIEVGAVGVATDLFPDWDRGVLEGAGDVLDVYVVHHYGTGASPDPARVLALPQQQLPALLARTRALLAEHGPGPQLPIALTEHNLVAFQDGDTGALMDRAVNALYTADVVGVLARHGVGIANHWNLANGQGATGTDYGLLDADTLERNPAYYAFALWDRFGDEVLPVDVGLSAEAELSVHAGRGTDGAVTLLAVNKTGGPLDVAVRLLGAPDAAAWRASADVVAADDLLDRTVTFNGVADPSVGLTEPGEDHGRVGSELRHVFAPRSVTLLRLEPTG